MDDDVVGRVEPLGVDAVRDAMPDAVVLEGRDAPAGVLAGERPAGGVDGMAVVKAAGRSKTETVPPASS